MVSITSTPATSSGCSSRRIAQRSKRTRQTVRRFHRKPDADTCVGLWCICRQYLRVAFTGAAAIGVTENDNGPVLLAAIESVVTPVAIDEHVFSCMLGATKPDPAAFLAALEFLDARPQQTFFVDDNPVNVLSARRLGIRGEQANKAADVESALRSVGLLRAH
nr:HAD-IA family hydrolase [Rhodococcus qingshengii]